MSDEKPRLLIVDDETDIRTAMASVFETIGFRVRSAPNGLSALEQIRDEVPDVILSDLNMPGMSGFELLSVVRRRMPGIFVIAMSGAFSGEGVQPGVAADAFYEKASKLHRLLNIVNNSGIRNASTATERSKRFVPIWIQGSAAPAPLQTMTVACPECLRTFPQTFDDNGDFIREVDCHHCRALISFAIVSPTDPTLPRSFQQKGRHLVHAEN